MIKTTTRPSQINLVFISFFPYLVDNAFTVSSPLSCIRNYERAILRPTPRIPNGDQVESQANHNQELVIQRWIGWLADDIEEKEESGDDNMHPAVSRLIQNQ